MNFISSADTAFVLISSSLVMLMTIGLAFFYGGLVRRKNILSIFMQCFIALCVITVQWFLFGYSLSFAPSSGFFGGLQWLGLNGVGLTPYPDYGPTIPHQAFMIYQAMFAIITPALIIGAFAERMKFKAYLIFIIAWATLVYAPICHWIWGVGGWLKNMGALDFAGGAVVHINAGAAALVTALMIGKRRHYGKKAIPPHNLPFAVLGAGLLWFGWFGFNAGSALAANSVAVSAFVATHAAAAAGGLIWALLEWLFNGKPTIFGTITGAVAGLATVTPAAGFISPMAGLAIGTIASVICFIFVAFVKTKLGYDDSLDAFGVHGVGGFIGIILTGVFASKAINPAGADGLLHGNPALFYTQGLTAIVVAAYALIATAIIFKLVDVFIGIRITEHEENIGLDLTEHHETAYTVLE
jgi:Amt family ammonium transporter